MARKHKAQNSPPQQRENAAQDEASASAQGGTDERAAARGVAPGTDTLSGNPGAGLDLRSPDDFGAGGASSAPEVLTQRKSARLFLPYQLAWINDESPRKLGDKSRRTGWTYCEAFDCVSRRWRKTARREMDYWFSSADESAAQEFIDYCAFFAERTFMAVADRFIDQIEDSESKRVATAYCLRTPSRNKIVAMTSNPRRFRSKGGDVGLDEFAFHDDARAMYTAASPVTTWGGTLRIFSTPNGEGSEFNKLVQRCRKTLTALGRDPDRGSQGVAFETLNAKARELHLTPMFSYHRVTINDAIEQGIVETINRTRGTHWTPDSFLLDCRDKSLDEDAYRQEYLCEPSADAAAWLTYALIESAEHDDCPAVGEPLTGYTGGPVYAGLDVGRKHDLTVLWLWEKVGDVLWARRVLRLRNMPLPDQLIVIAAALREVKLAALLGDQTGIGLGLVEWLQRHIGNVQGVTFTAAAKQAMAVDTKQAFEDRRVRIAARDGQLRDALHKVRKTVTAAGVVRFEASRDDAGHSDEFWAAAQGIHAAKAVNLGFLAAV